MGQPFSGVPAIVILLLALVCVRTVYHPGFFTRLAIYNLVP